MLCGPRELLSDEALLSAEAAIDDLAAAGGSVIWIARRPMDSAWSLPVGPLPLEASLAVAAFAGVPASQFHANRSLAIRWPGDLLQMSVQDAELPTSARAARDYLARLPRGIPRALLPDLPDFVLEALDDLFDVGFVRETDGGFLDVRGAVEVPIDRRLPMRGVPRPSRSRCALVRAPRLRPRTDHARSSAVALCRRRIGRSRSGASPHCARRS